MSHMMTIIQPTGRGDPCSPNGHRHLGHIDADDLGCVDAFTEHGAEVREAVFQQEAADALLTWEQGTFNSALAITRSESEDGDPESLPAQETEWGHKSIFDPGAFQH